MSWQAVKESSLKVREWEVGRTVGEVATDQSVDACQAEYLKGCCLSKEFSVEPSGQTAHIGAS